MSSSSSLTGQLVGSYRVLSILGEGGMGSVWLAEHTLLGRRVAIKMLRPQLSRQQPDVQRFFDEARAATRVADPGIVAVFDFGWHDDGSAYLVMEHLNGETLAARVEGAGRLTVADATRIAAQVALAMAAAHRAGIVHRDLKPDNIFIVADPAVPGGERIKVLDFGVAKLVGVDALHERTRTGVIMGTPTYMSPEQCRGAANVDHRTDVYALGGVLFHMLTGRPPFAVDTTADMIASQLLEDPPPPSRFAPELPPWLDVLTLRCLAKQPDARPATMSELATALLAPETVDAPPARSASADDPQRVALLSTLASGNVGEPAPPRRPGRARWLSVALTAALLAAIAVGLMGLLRTAPSAGQRAPRAVAVDAATSVVAIDAAAGDAGAQAATDAAPAAPAPAPSRPRAPKRPRGYDPYEDR